MTRKAKWQLMGCGLLASIGFGVMVASPFLEQPYWMTKRAWASYYPGECVQTVVPEVERWETPQRTLTLMIAEVGQERYRVRRWGRTAFSSSPQWYAIYEDRAFGVIDNRADFRPVPCPEEGRSELPEELLATQDAGAVGFSSDEHLIYTCDEDRGCRLELRKSRAQ